MSSTSEYAAKSLSATPHFDCGLNVGDTVEWVNDYGAVWEHKVIGFSEPCSVGFIHFDSGAYWFPHNLKCITKVNGVKFEHTSLLQEQAWMIAANLAVLADCLHDYELHQLATFRFVDELLRNYLKLYRFI